MRSSTGHTLTTDEAKKRCQKDTKVRYTDFSQHCISLARCQWKPWSMLIPTHQNIRYIKRFMHPRWLTQPSAQLNNIKGPGIDSRTATKPHPPNVSLRLALALFITLWCLNPTKNGSSTPLIYTTEHQLWLHMIIKGHRNMHLYSCSWFFSLGQ